MRSVRGTPRTLCFHSFVLFSYATDLVAILRICCVLICPGWPYGFLDLWNISFKFWFYSYKEYCYFAIKYLVLKPYEKFDELEVDNIKEEFKSSWS